MTQPHVSANAGSGDPDRRGVSERFRAAVRAFTPPAPEDLDVLPSRLAAAARDVLRVDGAGLSLFSDHFRLPLGSSDAPSTTVERLQFTLLQGPCWESVEQDLTLAVDGDTIRSRWPLFGADLHRLTPFRSVASAPLRLARSIGGALDLYFVDPVAALRFDLGDAVAVAAHIADLLNTAGDGDPGPSPSLQGPRWAQGNAARSRAGVWIAAGMLVGDGVATPDDAVAVLRARAFTEGVSVDAVAADLVERRRTTGQILRSAQDQG